MRESRIMILDWVYHMNRAGEKATAVKLKNRLGCSRYMAEKKLRVEEEEGHLEKLRYVYRRNPKVIAYYFILEARGIDVLKADMFYSNGYDMFGMNEARRVARENKGR